MYRHCPWGGGVLWEISYVWFLHMNILSETIEWKEAGGNFIVKKCEQLTQLGDIS